LHDPAAAVYEHFVEAAFGGPAIRFVAQVPLAENAGGIARTFQDLGDGRGLECEAFALVDRVRDAVPELMPSGHQGRARWRASRADVEIDETHALFVKRVRGRRVDERIAQAAIIAVADIVRHDN